MQKTDSNGKVIVLIIFAAFIFFICGYGVFKWKSNRENVLLVRGLDTISQEQIVLSESDKNYVPAAVEVPDDTEDKLPSGSGPENPCAGKSCGCGTLPKCAVVDPCKGKTCGCGSMPKCVVVDPCKGKTCGCGTLPVCAPKCTTAQISSYNSTIAVLQNSEAIVSSRVVTSTDVVQNNAMTCASLFDIEYSGKISSICTAYSTQIISIRREYAERGLSRSGLSYAAQREAAVTLINNLTAEYSAQVSSIKSLLSKCY